MKRKLRHILPVAAQVIAALYAVAFIIDLINVKLRVINNPVSKLLLLLFCVINIANAAFLISDARQMERARVRKQLEARRAAARKAGRAR